jgi:DNA (cytosine-5)-methyltransferase 1
MIKHYDLFAGIGGFSLALDTIFNDHEIKHIFCEWEAFPTAVLKKHWPDGTYYGDIADLVANTDSTRRSGFSGEDQGRLRQFGGAVQDEEQSMVILTGGFPCQPFSVAGRREGTADDRYKWPDMFAVIQNVQPDWVIAENVAGLNSMVQYSSGLEMEGKEYLTEQDARIACEKSHKEGQGLRTGTGVLGTVVGDLEREGYSIQTFIIPAVAIGAPHRRDRVWIVAHATHADDRGDTRKLPSEDEQQTSERQKERSTKPSCAGDRQWLQDWREVAFATCYDGVDDGIPRRMDGVTISASRHRKDRLKACGNAIVPQVAMEIFKAIKLTHPSYPPSDDFGHLQHGKI